MLKFIGFFTFIFLTQTRFGLVQNALIHYPCDGLEAFYQARRTTYDNWWVARLYLNEYSFHSKVRITVKVDEAGVIEVDPRVGEVTGPNVGHIFHISYYGSPANLTYVELRVRGLDDDVFPNLQALELNHHEICHRPKQWVNNNAEKTTVLTTSLLGGFLTTEDPYHTTTIKSAYGSNQVTSSHHHKPQQAHTTAPPKRTTTANLPILAGFSNLNGQSSAVARPVSTQYTPVSRPVKDYKCGRKKVQTQAFITSGWKSKPGDWPWHAAIYHRNHRSSTYKCGGTLLNTKTVLTAGHCCYSYGSLLIPERMSAHLGKYDLNRFDQNSVEYSVYNIVIHPEYSTVDYSNDLGLLQLAEQVLLTTYVQPVCLWPAEKDNLNNVVQKIGTVVGWGLNEKNQKESILNTATMPVVDFHECLESDRDFFGLFLSDYNFCAGFKNGTSVCQGDSGGGMFFEEEDGWHLRGLVSHGTLIQGTNLCNPRHFVVFTDVAKYRTWITSNW